jgi:aminopeptidase N
MMTDLTLTNRHTMALGTGFWQPEQRELTEPYVDRFFAEILPATAGRTGDMAQRLATWAYPGYAVEQSTVDSTDQVLARDGVPAGLRRALIAARDELRIALRARSR